jgi:hypothetical protein
MIDINVFYNDLYRINIMYKLYFILMYYENHDYIYDITIEFDYY